MKYQLIRDGKVIETFTEKSMAEAVKKEFEDNHNKVEVKEIED